MENSKFLRILIFGGTGPNLFHSYANLIQIHSAVHKILCLCEDLLNHLKHDVF